MSYFSLKVFHFHQQNKTKIKLSVHFSACIKKLTKIKLIKISFWALKHTSLVKNRLNFNFSKLSILQKGLLMQNWISRLRLWTKRWKNRTKKSLTLNFKVNQLPKFCCGPHRRCAAAFFFKSYHADNHWSDSDSVNNVVKKSLEEHF